MNDFLKDCGLDINEIREENINAGRKDNTKILKTCERLYKWSIGNYAYKTKDKRQADVTRLVMARKNWRQNMNPEEKEYDASVYNLVNATLKLLSVKRAQQNENR